MYRPKYYKRLDEEKIRQDIKKEGFSPILISDPPGRVYYPHKHPETKLLAILSGGMKVEVGKEAYRLSVGDKLIIPGNVEHSAVVGEEGCVFFWSEKLM